MAIIRRIVGIVAELRVCLYSRKASEIILIYCDKSSESVKLSTFEIFMAILNTKTD